MADWKDPRPMSPHLQTWKWHATMAASIFHRASGVALYLGAIMIAVWLAAAAAGPETYMVVTSALLSIPGRIVLLGFTGAIMFHIANGFKYLMWDGPNIGFTPKVASAVASFNIIFAVVGTLGLWAVAYFA